MSYEVDVRLPNQEDSDTKTWFNDLYLVKEEPLASLWPLHDEPLLCFDGPLETDKDGRVKTKEELQKEEEELVDWDKDPPTFSYLWQDGRKTPIRLPGPHIRTNLLGRTAEECFRDFPNDFEDSPPSSPSQSLSPISPFSPNSSGEENSGRIPTYDLPDTSVDEMSQQLSDRIYFDSPLPQSPIPIPVTNDTVLPPLSRSTCDPLSVNSLSDSYSSSSTLSVGTSSTAPSTYAASPSPKPFIASSSESPPGPRRSPRISLPLSMERDEPGDPYKRGGILNLTIMVPPPNQIVLEEAPTIRRSVKRNGSYDDDEDFDSQMDDIDARPRKKIVRVAPKRHPCTVPGCHESFTRPNDVLRHVKNAAIHKGSAQQAAALAASSTLCKYCGEELSRADAARRHELKSSCGKRTINRKSNYSMLPA
ncbi:hypothetical protein C8F04DRAFT_1087007 [Mycena alexandri]|uniref:C2H2-type domain-containing protein n=1 Tax=Mycena alexandri TaxID=1745969 RepID=A0AAD6T838_9AGAR|nr:hypothetical protein C8F04DRAFT_1087007 [Mycena alexandri]